jgi:hypothetical protein
MLIKWQCYFSYLFTTLLVSSCATGGSIVKKPEIGLIKKIALVSITAPQRVPHREHKGVVQGWGDDNRNAIADQALVAYSTEFKKLGWSIIPTAQLSALSSYQENFSTKISKSDIGVGKALNSLSASDAHNTYFSPSELYPIVWDENKGQKGEMYVDWGKLSLEKTGTLKDKMQAVATQAGADAAVLVQADYCYDNGSIWVGHAKSKTGSAVITGASSIYAVTPKGVEVVKMKRIPGPCQGDNRLASDSITVMVNNNIMYNDETIRKMFREVACKNAAGNVKTIMDAIK